MKTTEVKNLLIVLVTSLTFIQPANSEVSVIGSSDCGQWAANSKSNPRMRAWLLGFMSGINAGLGGSNNNPLRKLNSAEQIYLWMDNFCQKNPLETVQDGGAILFNDLVVMKK